MQNQKCLNCSENKNCKDSYVSWIFFIIGLIATIAMRIVTVLMHMNSIYGKVAWYIGVGGFFVFFVYKFRVTQARSSAVKNTNLVDKINQKQNLSTEDYNIIGAILCSLSSKKEKINYFFIFALSALALLLAIYIDFFR